MLLLGPKGNDIVLMKSMQSSDVGKKCLLFKAGDKLGSNSSVFDRVVGFFNTKAIMFVTHFGVCRGHNIMKKLD